MSEIPAGARQPNDRKKKSTEPERLQAMTVEVDGHEYTITADAMDDFELLDDLHELDYNEDPTRMPSVLKRLIGVEASREVMRRLRDKETGRVPIEVGVKFVGDLMEALNPNS